MVNELSLFLRGFLFASLLLGCLLLSCHIVLLLSCGYDHKILYSRNSCGLEKTAHNILLYKLKLHPCQQLIAQARKYFQSASVTDCVGAITNAEIRVRDRPTKLFDPKSNSLMKKDRSQFRFRGFKDAFSCARIVKCEQRISSKEWCEDPFVVTLDTVVGHH